MNSTISTPFLSQKTVANSSLTDSGSLKFFILFGECVCIHCFDCSLVSSPVTHTMWLRNPLPSLWYHSKKIKAEAILCIHTHPLAFLETFLCKSCDSQA
jgi:hypothetical protein